MTSLDTFDANMRKGRAILTAVSRTTGVNVTDIRGSARPAKLVTLRHITMYLCWQHTDLTLAEIGEIIGGRCPAAVSYGVRQIEARQKGEARVTITLRRVCDRLKEGADTPADKAVALNTPTEYLY